MEINYFVIQAGGLGTRLGVLTKNKPKGIVSVNNLPIIFHLMNVYPNKKFIIIGDYKCDVLEKYLECFCESKYVVVKANEKGTCAGLKQAMSYIPNDEPFMLIWSDLMVDKKFDFDSIDGNCVGLSNTFSCRWQFKDNRFIKESSNEYGVAGCFTFLNKKVIEDVPLSGEFVEWLSKFDIEFETFYLNNVVEVGTMEAYDSQKVENVCRPFNSLEVVDDKIIKKPITVQGEKIAYYEINWYKELTKLKFNQMPNIYSFNPLTMKKINGSNAFKLNNTLEDKKKIIENYVNGLKELHSLGEDKVNYFSLLDNYYTKTINRINKIRDLVPFANEVQITINGYKCKNVFFIKHKLKQMIEKYLFDTKFTIIHGDCTFSNAIVDKDLNVIFIDPRGYFGETLLYGDEYYDWAKLYYSINGNYDQFNNKRFTLNVNENDIELNIQDSGYSCLTDYYLSLIPDCDVAKIELLNAIIWLSLSTYAWDDYDSICGAFYNGVLLLNKFMEKYHE